MVLDPLLETHLAHFGIRIADMRKSDKSMLELELELNSQERATWDRVQEAGHVCSLCFFVHFVLNVHFIDNACRFLCHCLVRALRA
jgi:uncharacterized UBP type Zn finger protein